MSVEVQPNAFTAGGIVGVDLTFDYTGGAPFISGNGVGGAVSPPLVVVSGSYVLAAGAAIQVYVYNGDGVSARTFVIKNAFVSRIGPA